jgi:acetyl-CoA carboxylase biotin carboxyl carrier protein
MDLKNIKLIIEMFEKSKLSALEVEQTDLKIKMQKPRAMPQAFLTQAPPQTARVLPSAQATTDLEEKEKDVINFNDLYEVKSPLVGIFYQASKPDSPPLVQKGDEVKKGDILCIIEAMKVMNEITAEKDGEIVDICAVNGQLVEYSQVLFKIK